MKKNVLLLLALPLVLGTAVYAENLPWQHLSDPTAAQLAKNFASPPSQYSTQLDFGFSSSRSTQDIDAMLDNAKAVHVSGVFVEPKSGKDAYLSPGYFSAVKVLVQEAKKRDMHLWFDDDGGYPSGFAGGIFSKEHPELRMMALATPQRTSVSTGQVYACSPSPQVICTLAVNAGTHAAQVLEPVNGSIHWMVPDGVWEIVQPVWAFRSGPTRSANNSGGKSNEHSLMDYLNPEADRIFAQRTFDAYKDAVGGEFGKTILGFRGDEPAFGFNPWSAVMLDEFQKRKGYDLRLHLADVAAISINAKSVADTGPVNLDEAHRVYADYCDVWSDLFGENFFGTEGKWAAANNLEMQMHIEHEEILPMLAIADGDFFKCMRNIQIPGVDTIWHQIWHDVVADFPKLASSATHLNGTPRAFCEAFAAYKPVPDVKEAGWILNHLMVQGISRVEYMGLQSVGAPHGFYADAAFPALSLHVNRALYLLGEGRPTAQIGVYIPSSSYWLKDAGADVHFLAIVHALLEHQRDLDYVDEDALSRTLALRGRELVNLSGQPYRAILVPPVAVMSKAALQRLHDFAAAGGTVLFFGNAPTLVTDKNFLTATGPADISWATLIPAPEMTDKVLQKLPAPDVILDHTAPGVKYNHRQLKEGDLYFFFNDGDTPLHLNALLTCQRGATTAEHWNTTTGTIETWKDASTHDGQSTVSLQLPPWGTTTLVLSSREDAPQ